MGMKLFDIKIEELIRNEVYRQVYDKPNANNFWIEIFKRSNYKVCYEVQKIFNARIGNKVWQLRSIPISDQVG